MEQKDIFRDERGGGGGKGSRVWRAVVLRQSLIGRDMCSKVRKLDHVFARGFGFFSAESR
jgi:hypothetical protein